MKRILIFNLKRFGDIFAMSHTIQSIKAESPHVEIGVLVYKEFERAANCLAGITKVYSLDRKRLSLITKKTIFDSVTAFEELAAFTGGIEADGWDTVFNYSNDPVATHLTSFFTGKDGVGFIGIRMSEKGNIEYSNEWSLIFNDVVSEHTWTPIHFRDIYNNMALTTTGHLNTPLLRNSRHDDMAKTNFDHLRNNGRNANDPRRIVGLQLTSSTPTKSIPKEILSQFITLTENTEDYKVVLLIAPTDQERNYASELNNEFNNELVVVEADFKALVSVVAELDYLVTPDTAVKHMADLFRKPVLEVNLGEVSFRKQGTITPGNIVFRPVIGDGRSSHSLTGKDLFNGLESLAYPDTFDMRNFTEELRIYKVESDAGRVNYHPARGKFNVREELNSHVLGIFFTRHWLQFPKSVSNEMLETFSSDSINKWVSAEKEEIAVLSKALLKTLRSLIQAKENRKYGASFIESLDSLLDKANSDNLCSALVLITRGRLENNLKGSVEENHLFIEKSLYELKGMIQQLNSIINEVENIVRRSDVIRKSTFSERQIVF